MTAPDVENLAREMAAAIHPMAQPAWVEVAVRALSPFAARLIEAERERDEARSQVAAALECDRIWAEEFDKDDDPQAATIRVLRARNERLEAGLRGARRVLVAYKVGEATLALIDEALKS